MAKKDTVTRAPFVGFVNVELTTSDEKMIQKLLTDADKAFELIDTVLVGAYDIKANYNSQHMNYNVTISCWDSKHQNGGKVVSSFGASWYMAMVVCAYKVVHILGDSTWSTADSAPKKAFG